MAEFVKFKHFSRDDDQDIVEWRKSLSRNLKFLAWPQQRCIDLIPTLLTDKALKYYESLSTETQANYDKLLQALEDKFSPTRNATLYIAALQQRNQHHYESVADYTKAMNKIFQKLQMNDSFNTMTTYIRGLLPEIRSELIKQRPKSFEDAQELALVIEASNKQSHKFNKEVERAVKLFITNYKFTTAASNPSAYVLLPNAPFCRRCNCKHSFGQHIQQINFKQNQSGRPTFSHTSRQTGRTSFNQRLFRPSNPNNTQQRRYNPHKQQTTQNITPIHTTRPNIVCYNRNQTGHKARECRQQTLEIVNIHNAGTTIMPKFPKYEGGYVKCKALIDSGASISVMQQKTLQNILKQGCIKGTKVQMHHKELAALFQGKAKINQCYRLKIIFQKTPIEIDFHIINDFGIPEGYDLILGRDFLNKTGAVIDYSKRQLFLHHPQKYIQRRKYMTQLAQQTVPTLATIDVMTSPSARTIKDSKSQHSQANDDKVVKNKQTRSGIGIQELKQVEQTTDQQTNLQKQRLNRDSKRHTLTANKSGPKYSASTNSNYQEKPVVNWDKRTTENLTQTKAQQLETRLQENELAFVKSDNVIGFCTIMPCKRQPKNRKKNDPHKKYKKYKQQNTVYK